MQQHITTIYGLLQRSGGYGNKSYCSASALSLANSQHPAALCGRVVVDTVIEVTDRSRQLSNLSQQRAATTQFLEFLLNKATTQLFGIIFILITFLREAFCFKLLATHWANKHNTWILPLSQAVLPHLYADVLWLYQ